VSAPRPVKRRVRSISTTSVTIKTIECAIVDRGWQEGWIEPGSAAATNRQAGRGRRLGPAGLACAQQLARAGHSVTGVREGRPARRLTALRHPRFQDGKAADRPPCRPDGGRRVIFCTEVEVGVNLSIASLLGEFDAMAMTGGAEQPRDLEVPGRELDGIHFAMDFLPQQNKRNAGDSEERAAPHGTLTAQGKNVIVIGGGDTGSDCIGTSVRQGARSITQNRNPAEAAGA